VAALAGSLSIGLLRRMNRPCWVPVRQFGRKFSEKEQGGFSVLVLVGGAFFPFFFPFFLSFLKGATRAFVLYMHCCFSSHHCADAGGGSGS